MSEFKESIDKVGNKLFRFGNAAGMGVRISNDEWGETLDELIGIARKMDKHIDSLETDIDPTQQPSTVNSPKKEEKDPCDGCESSDIGGGCSDCCHNYDSNYKKEEEEEEDKE